MSKKKLFEAAFLLDLEQLEQLIEKGIDVNVQGKIAHDSGSTTPLHYAAKGLKSYYRDGKWVNLPIDNSIWAVRMLLEAGADPNAVYGKKNSPLWWSIYTGAQIDVVTLLIEYGAKFNKNDSIHQLISSLANRADGQEMIDLITDVC